MKKKILLASILLFSSSSFAAVCDAPFVHTFSDSSNVIKWHNEFNAQMASDAVTLAQQIEQSFRSFSAIVGDASANIIASNMDAAQKIREKKLNDQKQFLLQRQDLLLEMLNQQVKDNMSLAATSKEEVELILAFLDEAGEGKNIAEINAMLLSQYEPPTEENPQGGMWIGVQTLAGEKNCTKEDNENQACSIKTLVQPAETLDVYFKACNTVKKAQVLAERSSVSRKGAITQEAQETKETVNSIDSTSALVKSRKEMENIVCTPELRDELVCLEELSKPEIQVKIAKNEIIPNGNISPANAFNPQDMGGFEYTTYSPDEIEALKEAAYHYRDFEGDEQEFQNAQEVPFIYTYRNSSQLKSAISYADSITGTKLLSNQEPRLRQRASSAEFQARFGNRLASLNLAKSVFYDAIKTRTGKDLGKIWAGDGDVALDDLDHMNVRRESYLGAGELDMLLNKVNSAYKEIALNDDLINTATKQEELANKNEKYWMVKNYEMTNLQNQILFQQILQNEKSELLKAAQLQTLINNPENINYIKNLRK